MGIYSLLITHYLRSLSFRTHYSLLIICEAYPLGLITHYLRSLSFRTHYSGVGGIGGLGKGLMLSDMPGIAGFTPGVGGICAG